MIGKRLKLAREAAGLSLRAMEEAIRGKVSAQAIGKYENDQMMPGSDVLLALARALKVSPEYLLEQPRHRTNGRGLSQGTGCGCTGRESRASRCH